MTPSIFNIMMVGIFLGTIAVQAQHESTPASAEKGSGLASSAQTPTSGEVSSSSSPSSLPSQPPHPPASEPAPSEQKVSSLSAEKEKPEENSDAASSKEPSSNVAKPPSGASSSAEVVGHPSASDSPSSTPSSNGVTGITVGWVGPSLLAFALCLLLA